MLTWNSGGLRNGWIPPSWTGHMDVVLANTISTERCWNYLGCCWFVETVRRYFLPSTVMG
jgi:hypothetical protein